MDGVKKKAVRKEATFGELLAMKDMRIEHTEDGDRISQFFSYGIVWRLNTITNQIEVIIVDSTSADNAISEVVFPGAATDLYEGPRDAFGRALLVQTGLRAKGNEWLIFSRTKYSRKQGSVHTVKSAKLAFSKRVGYIEDYNFADQVNHIEGSAVSNPRWHPVGDELLAALAPAYRPAYRKFVRKIVAFILKKNEKINS